jgi:hypothetical protein
MAENTVQTNLKVTQAALKPPRKANLWIKYGVPLQF